MNNNTTDESNINNNENENNDENENSFDGKQLIADKLLEMYHSNELTFNQMVSEATMFAIAALETTSNAMTTIIYALARKEHSKILLKLQEEIDHHFPEKSDLTDLNENSSILSTQMPVLDAVINECLRIWGPTPIYGRVIDQKIEFDDYLAGVLPYEIGPNSPLEALKAQAVIARTWGIFNSDRFNMDKYHLCISTQCQVYKPPTIKNKKVQKVRNQIQVQRLINNTIQDSTIILIQFLQLLLIY